MTCCMSDQWFYKQSGFRWSFVNNLIRCWDGGHQPEAAEYVTTYESTTRCLGALEPSLSQADDFL